MTNKTEAQIFADDRPSSLDDDLYQWSLDAEIMLRAQAYRIAQLEAELIQQTNRAASAEQQVTALNRRLDDANAMGNEARHKLAQLSQAQAVPTEGWKLVPVEPTEDMFVEGMEADCVGMPSIDDDRHVRSIWSAMLAASPTPPARKECWCTTCRPITLSDMRFVVCPDCGNKRCPKANHHDNACTNSNAPGQPGSRWEHVRPHGIQGEGNE